MRTKDYLATGHYVTVEDPLHGPSAGQNRNLHRLQDRETTFPLKSEYLIIRLIVLHLSYFRSHIHKKNFHQRSWSVATCPTRQWWVQWQPPKSAKSFRSTSFNSISLCITFGTIQHSWLTIATDIFDGNSNHQSSTFCSGEAIKI